MRDWNHMRSLLVVRLDGMGDLLMTTPALRALKERAPARRLTLLTSAAGAIVGRHLPYIDAVMVYAAPWAKNAVASTTAANVAVLETLRAARYDGAIIFTVCTQSALPSALMLLLAGVHRRLAYARQNPYALLTDWHPDPDLDVRDGCVTKS
ncbi:MAG TPA: glycosyltransferase family 9 protein, partial [Casimicrobiaceae bacterium]|nr:glycosyltransferase family 9 protein [Casimicrobiaceae bacterium]